jgi:hypothetical protein
MAQVVPYSLNINLKKAAKVLRIILPFRSRDTMRVSGNNYDALFSYFTSISRPMVRKRKE